MYTMSLEYNSNKMPRYLRYLLLVVAVSIFLYLIRDAVVNIIDIFRTYPLGFIVVVLIIFIFGKSMDIKGIQWDYG